MDAHRAAADRALNAALGEEKDLALAAMIGVSRSQVRHWLGKDGQPVTPPVAMIMGLDPETRAKVYAAIEAECGRRSR